MDFVRSPERHRLPLAMVSVLLLIAVLLPWSLSLVWQKHQMARQRHPEKISFRDWKNADFAVWGSKLRGMHAAIDMLLPLAAVAFGLTALGIVFLICKHRFVGPALDNDRSRTDP
jgi:hypothetical protein